jgi:hypothetical protein
VKKLLAIVLVGLMLVPVLAVPAHAGGGCCWGWGGFALGLGIGALAAAPLWYPRVYAYPAYPYPVYSYPAYAYPAYSYPAYAYPVYSYPAYSYSYPAYSYPAYPAPTYASPTSPGATRQPSQSTNLTVSSPAANPPTVQTSAPASAGSQSCYTVTVDGHNETRTLANGQSVTAWVPTYSQQVCQ